MLSSGWPERALTALVACSMEAGWITLVYVTAEGTWAGGYTPLSLLAFFGAALLGLAVARWSAGDAGRPYPAVLAGVAVAMSLLGWLLPLGSGAADVIQAPAALLGAHPGGLLLGLAVLRGAAHASTDGEERIAETALGTGLVGVVACWLLLTASGLTHDPSIVAPAFAATLTFVTAGLLAIGLARLADLRHSGVAGADRRTWVSVLLGVVAVLLAVSLPLAAILGVPLATALRGVLGPLADILIVVGTVLLWPVALLAAALTAALVFLRDLGGGAHDPGAGGGITVGDWFDQMLPAGTRGLALGALPVLVAVVVAFLVLRTLLRRPRRVIVEGEVVEERESEPASGGIRIRRRPMSLPRRHPVPRTASEAYIASLELLAVRPDVARFAPETPAEHARRLPDDQTGTLMRRLAADFALVEFGRRTLPAVEHRRAVERWRRLRATVRR